MKSCMETELNTQKNLKKKIKDDIINLYVCKLV